MKELVLIPIQITEPIKRGADMSILNDDRRYSDDPEEYLAWREEVKREYAREEYEDDQYPEEEGDEE